VDNERRNAQSFDQPRVWKYPVWKYQMSSTDNLLEKAHALLERLERLLP